MLIMCIFDKLKTKNMNTKRQIERHQTCIDILEGIQHFEMMISHTETSIEAGKKWCSDFVPKWEHKVLIYYKCIERLKDRYLNVLKTK